VRRDFDSRQIKNNKEKKPNYGTKRKPSATAFLWKPVEEKEVKKGRNHHSRYRQRKTHGSLVVALGTGKTDDNGKKVPLKSRRVTACSSANTAAPKSNSTARNIKILNSDDVLAVDRITFSTINNNSN
jgi:chaperonin GroES